MFIFSLLSLSSAMLPGLNQRIYTKDEDLILYVNKLDSSKTLLPYEYNFLKYCPTTPDDTIDENIGQELSGDKPQLSQYKIKMNQNETCKHLCGVPLTDEDISNFNWMIQNDYRASWILDSLPGGEIKSDPEKKCKKYFYNNGFPVGFIEGNQTFVFNHHNIEVHIYKESYTTSPETFSIVGFMVEPQNLALSTQSDTEKCEKEAKKYSKVFQNDTCPTIYTLSEALAGSSIEFTYSVWFIPAETKWDERWQNYLAPSSRSPDSAHYFSLLQSTVMVFLLTGMLATILRRSVLRDVNFYNDSIDTEIETGWKQVRSDVFRTPMYSSLFCITIGTGTQLLATVYIVLFFALLHFLSPKNQGVLLQGAFIFYALMGIFAGYTSARFYKLFNGKAWQKNAIGTAILLPGLCFSVFLFLNLILWAENSSGQVSFHDLLFILAMWLAVSLSLVYVGALVGNSKDVLKVTCKVAKIPKPIELTPGLNKLRLAGFLAGFLPFGSVLIEVTYIMTALWHPEQFYYLFGFLFICSVILVITSAEAAILLVYLLLSREDYRWWWLSFFVPGSSGVYLFLYAFYYCFVGLNLTGFSAYMLYFGYMFLICVGFMIVTGTIGFYASYFFIRMIYSMIKQD